MNTKIQIAINRLKMSVKAEHLSDLKIITDALAGMDSEPVAALDIQSGRPDGNKFALVYSSAAHRLPDDVYYLYAAPPAPVAVPDKWPEKLTWSHHDDMTQAEVLAWNNAIDACRAAILKGGKS